MPVTKISEDADDFIEEHMQDGETKKEAASRIILDREPEDPPEVVDYGRIEDIIDDSIERKLGGRV